MLEIMFINCSSCSACQHYQVCISNNQLNLYPCFVKMKWVAALLICVTIGLSVAEFKGTQICDKYKILIISIKTRYLFTYI